MSSASRLMPLRSSMNRPSLSGVALVAIIFATLTALLVSTQSVELALSALAAVAFIVCLMVVPTFWMAVLLIVVVPFHGLITVILLEACGSNARQLFAVWKEVLILIGIFRVLRTNPNRWRI